MGYDVVVIGAGPAGSSAAFHTARLGLSTLLLDQAVFPRDKACAGGLTMAARAFLPATLPDQLSLCTINKLSSWLNDHQLLHNHPQTFMTTVDRVAFDAWLLNHAVDAGATPGLGQRALGYQRVGDLLHIKTTSGDVHGRLIIGADGANSLIARQARRKQNPSLGYCLQAVVPGQGANDTIEIHYGIVPEGYGWVFPRPHSRVIGVGGQIGHKKQQPTRLHLQTLLAAYSDDPPASIQAHTIPIGGQWLPVSGDGVMLVGDAAGFVDPFTGEGIRFALLSGQLAAQTAKKALTHPGVPTADRLVEYEKACRSEIMPQLHHALRISKAFFRFKDQLHARLFGTTEPVEHLLSILQGTSNYTMFTRWLLRNLPRLLLI